ncbi:MAG: hypothetical protein H6667_24395 [Ardenticatenaceae bacterium]|nr:hypothetical protein [Ardenticatenaceae bacterium]MCB9444936.1 hypothetical protein [Ardenticatenaceae bacterium]
MESTSYSLFRDDLAFSLYHLDFEIKALRLLKLARAALVYLSLTIHREEFLRQQKPHTKGLIVSQNLGVLEDEWKI